MTNTPESDTMKTLLQTLREISGTVEINGKEYFELSDDTELLATFNAWMAQQKSHANVLANELRNIAEAKRFKKEFFEDDKAFADWAQNRARHTLAAYEANQPII